MTTLPSFPAGRVLRAADLATLLTVFDEATISPYAFKLNATGTSVADSTDTRIGWSTTVSSNGVTIASSRSVTLNRVGRWLFRVSIRYPAGGTAGREHYAAVRRMTSGGTAQEIIAANVASTATGNAAVTAVGTMVVATASHVVEAWGFQASGGAKTPEADPYVSTGGTCFEGVWIAEA